MTAEAPGRTTFVTSRLLEFFSEKELAMQIGHPRPVWPRALLKELIDNALDAAETADVLPEIVVTIDPDAVSVQDNGPGLPVATLEKSLDYMVRVSDKAHYVSPTRGQLGNALKCVWAAPYVDDGAHGRVEVVTGGLAHTIDVRLNRLAQAPDLSLTHAPDGVVKNGTLVRMHWPGIASYLERPSPEGFYSAPGLLSAYAAFNPHATFVLRNPEGTWRWDRTADACAKWGPREPTSAHWYTPEQLRDLIAAYVAEERRGGKARTVRELVSEFRGLSSTAKQKKIGADTGLAGAWLRDLICGEDVDPTKVRTLLAAMRAESRPVPPEALGVLGEDHLWAHLVGRYHVARDSVRYTKRRGLDGGMPYVLEAAFGIYEEEYHGFAATRLVGLNWSPSMGTPIPQLRTALAEVRIDAADPVMVVVHLAYPRLNFVDRGKANVAVS